ncbi:YbhB/YbcL family Raf kinase inhibitor-like protein [Sporocytophaga myxococcoides]|uniref:YbhB/YbcL family Raf kinase inhibitor-like protein n=1 Tax=Sporocytophaga myxococcoides TaxID=153721 RepID=UPI00040FAE54|nr:YbhB/YbcL family Raf kinase inhibitor-like protein [Sporocytophaga myxococcoides]
MKLLSSEFKNGVSIPKKYTCEGPNISPPLQFIDIPSNASTLVLTVEDADTEGNIPWVHWLVFNIPATSNGFEEGMVSPGSIEGLCNGNTFGYEGPCPPENIHRYVFKLYALDIVLAIAPESNKETVLKLAKRHIIEEAELVGLYQKEKLIKEKVK